MSMLPVEQLRSELIGRPQDELREALTRCLRHIGKSIRDAAAIVGELESRGEDLSDIPGLRWLLPYLRRIHAGQMLPELLTNQLGSMNVVERAQFLPLPDQKKVADDEPLPVVILDDAGLPQTVVIAPSRMRPEQVQAVFNKGHIRSEPEQVAAVRARQLPGKKQLVRAICKVDKRNRRLVIADTFYLTPVELEAYLRQLKDAD
jgi:hypothetical protein